MRWSSYGPQWRRRQSKLQKQYNYNTLDTYINSSPTKMSLSSHTSLFLTWYNRRISYMRICLVYVKGLTPDVSQRWASAHPIWNHIPLRGSFLLFWCLKDTRGHQVLSFSTQACQSGGDESGTKSGSPPCLTAVSSLRWTEVLQGPIVCPSPQPVLRSQSAPSKLGSARVFTRGVSTEVNFVISS